MKVLEPGATPAEVAQTVMDNITEDQPGFDMNQWAAYYGDARRADRGITLDTAPSVCGTTLCAAGWTALTLGWTVYPGGDAMRKTGPDASPVPRHVESIASKALGLTPGQGDFLWYASKEKAWDVLGRIARGETIASTPVDG